MKVNWLGILAVSCAQTVVANPSPDLDLTPTLLLSQGLKSTGAGDIFNSENLFNPSKP